MATTEPEVTGYHKMNSIFATRDVANYAPHLIPYLKPGIKILDVGCGIGTITMDFAERVPDGEVVGVDVNSESIAKATAAAKDAGRANVKFQELDVADLDSLESNTFDIVHAHQVMLHLKDPVSTLKQLRRIVKTNGIVSTRDNADLHWVGANKTMQHMLDSRDRLMQHSQGGKENHIWMHEAGFPWADIAMGSAAWDFSGPEGRKIWSTGIKDSSRAYGLKIGFADNAFYDRLTKSWEEWEEKDEGRILGLDSWVIATKS